MRKTALFLLAVAALAQTAGADPPRKRAVVLVFPGVQIIDFTGPYEVLGQAGLKVDSVAERPGPLTTSMGLTITPAYTFADAPKADVVVVPGGGVDAAQDRPAVQKWLRDASKDAQVVLSVCNGAFILARAGLLDGLSATTFAGLIDGLKEIAPRTRVVDDRRYVDNGKVVTAAGLSSGLDGALHVVEKLYGKGTAQKVATNLEYNWDPEGHYVRALLADRQLAGVYHRLRGYERDLLSHEGSRDRWKNRWVVKGATSAGELLQAVKSGLPGGEATEATDAKGKVESAFRFTDEKGARWSGTASVARRGESTFDVTVSLRRG